MKLPRLTVSRLMILVAILGLSSGGVAMWQRSDSCRSRARVHAVDQARREESARIWQTKAEEAGRLASSGKVRADAPHILEERAASLRDAVALLRRKAAHHGELAAKYDRIARRPWLAIDPDSPEPE